ncbi:hypothetical protein CROQUDRAFT_96586 [Cronartium quercuum f. sp. fusiforme G11]|uniref:Uncharacterized protein n=1 Tax=Cronartium quercuum f. sp. fusiforme G11 TaxID=708437 RepID=A0A9P6TA49_9BASI|nr:hypothetical protein CROQUDRAFT_96586 [Cronartium quercuum f. sp. fusiforme G11]
MDYDGVNLHFEFEGRINALNPGLVYQGFNNCHILLSVELELYFSVALAVVGSAAFSPLLAAWAKVGPLATGCATQFAASRINILTLFSTACTPANMGSKDHLWWVG